jgi:hypothetical protein
MARTYRLNHFTKGTGAAVEPLEEDAKQNRERGLNRVPVPARERATRAPRSAPTSSPLPPGHVRKKSTGELGRIQALDPKAGTATVLWLRQGRTSTVRLADVTRR